MFWLAAASLFCFVLERIFPWRRKQKAWHPELAQDLFWLVFNGYGAAFVFGGVFTLIFIQMDAGFFSIVHKNPNDFKIVADIPLAIQVVIFLITADFIEWCVHNLLHRVNLLLKNHCVHHSIEIMDWIGNFRFHWGELFVYKTVKYVPLALLGATWEAIIICSVIATLIGHLNHSNVNISWGPFRYILNSSRMHIWHHEKEVRGKAGVNIVGLFFCLVFNKVLDQFSCGFRNIAESQSYIQDHMFVGRHFHPFDSACGPL